MPVVISGTNGVSGVDGTASNPSYEGTDSNTGIFFPAADTIAFAEGGTEVARFDSSGRFGIQTTNPLSTLVVSNNANENIEFVSGSASLNGGYLQYINRASASTRPDMNYYLSFGGGSHKFYTSELERMRIDSSGNLGLGVTPSAWNADYKAIDVSTYATLYGRVTTPTSGFSSNSFRNAGGSWIYKTTSGASRYEQDSGLHIWFNAPSGTAGNAITFTQAMTLDGSGNLLVGASTAPGGDRVYISKGNDRQLYIDASTAGNGVYTTISFANQGAIKVQMYWLSTDSRFYIQNGTGGVYLAQNATAWTANSDERLKTDLVPIENAAQKVSTLRAVTGRYITDEEGVSRAFLIAQDVQAVLPEAVDATDTEKLGVAYTDTIPLLVAAIKEQQQMIETLQAKVAALEAK